MGILTPSAPGINPGSLFQLKPAPLGYAVRSGIRIGATASYVSAGSGATASTNAVNTQASGSSFIFSLMTGSGVSKSAPTDNYGNTYSKIAEVRDTVQGTQVQLWYVMNGAGGPGHTWTQAFADRFSPDTASVTEIIGGATSGLLDAVNFGTVSGNPDSMPVTTLSDKTLILTTLAGNNTGGGSPQNQFGKLFAVNTNMVLAYTATVKGTFDPNPTFVSANGFSFITASFKELGSTIQVGSAAITGPGIQPAQRFQFKRSLGDTFTSVVFVAAPGTQGKNLAPAAPGIQPSTRFMFQSSPRSTAAVLVSGNLTFALSGISSSSTAGTLNLSALFTLPVTGLSSTLSPGSVGLNSLFTMPLVGLSSALSAGSVSLASLMAIPVTGRSSTVSAGTLNTSNLFTVPLTGLSSTLSAGTVTYSAGGNITLALTGLSVTLTAGTVLYGSSVPVTGISSALSAGTLTISWSVSLTATSSAGSAGSMIPSASIPTTGISLALSAGTIAAAMAKGVTGGSITISAGSLIFSSNLILAGLSSSLSAGTVTYAQSGNFLILGLSGISVVLTPGTPHVCWYANGYIANAWTPQLTKKKC